MVEDTFLSREILDQPDVIRLLLSNEIENVRRIADAIRRRSPHFAMFVARGSSDNAARYGQYIFGVTSRLPVALATPSLYTLYGAPPRLQDAFVLAISQSGQSPDIVSVIEEGRRQSANTVAITNDLQSPLATAAEHMISLHAGKEQSVAATKTYTASLFALAMLSTLLADDQDGLVALHSVPDFISQVIKTASDTIKAAERYRYMEACVVLSRGYNYATAFEIALLAVVPEGALADELVDFLSQLNERGAELVVISSHPDALALARTPLPIPAGIPEWLSPIVTVVQGQLFALGLTLAKGFDPDHPRGLHKVTLTE
jgi:glucosamine--fructose-6-phosphate aminotransferase (isomerizing)